MSAKTGLSLCLSLLFGLTLQAATEDAQKSSAALASAAQPAIRLINYKGGETIRYPVPLIRGELADRSLAVVSIVNTTSKRDTREMTGLAYKGRFKALTELVPGVNKLVIRAGGKELPLELTYQPQTNPYFVRCVYLTDNTGTTQYQSTVENDAQDYVGNSTRP